MYWHRVASGEGLGHPLARAAGRGAAAAGGPGAAAQHQIHDK